MLQVLYSEIPNTFATPKFSIIVILIHGHCFTANYVYLQKYYPTIQSGVLLFKNTFKFLIKKNITT